MFSAASATLVGSIGVSLLLVAFFLNLFRLLRADRYTYILLNLAGGALACLSSWMIDFIPFVVLEGTWALVAAIALVKRIAGARADDSPANTASTSAGSGSSRS